MRKTIFPVMFFFLFGSAGIILAEKPPDGEGKHFLEKKMYAVEGIDIKLIPEFDQQEEILQELPDFAPELCTELLYRMRMPEIGSDEESKLSLLNSLSRLSTLEGVKYYSSNADAMIVFIEECAVVDHKYSRKPLPDPCFETIPKEESFVFYQKDSTFGSNWYDITIRVSPDAIRLTMINISPMWYKIVPAMGSEEVKIDLVVIPGEEELIFYSLCQVEKNFKKVFNRTIRLEGTFDHRISAMQGWFADRIYGQGEG